MRVLSRRCPRFDRHLLIAEQRAGVGQKRARKTITRLHTSDHESADEQNQQRVTQLVRINFIEARTRRAEMNLVGIFQQPIT